MELDKVLDLLDTEFHENMSVYTAFSIFSNDEIIKEVHQYMTEKRYDSTTADRFLYAFSRIGMLKEDFLTSIKYGKYK